MSLVGWYLVTVGLVILGPLVAGWALSRLDPPPPPPERLTSRLWASRSLWRERR